MDWYSKLATLTPDFEDSLFSALRVVEKEVAKARDPGERKLLSDAYDALWKAYNMRASRQTEAPLGWANPSGGWTSE